MSHELCCLKGRDLCVIARYYDTTVRTELYRCNLQEVLNDTHFTFGRTPCACAPRS